ncbi:MAG: energy transducer TonB [Methylococcaceae bacterium]|nr:MAG: energy transducer TonB [Methylococcaceae bacterium]
MMQAYFVDANTASWQAFLPVPAGLPKIWRRRGGVALAAAMAGILHGAALLWYFDSAQAQPVTVATPLPSIDIALAAPPMPTPLQPQAVVPPEPPKPVPVPPKPKLKPKPERKIPLTKPQAAPEASPPQEPPPHAAPSVTGSHADAVAERSEAGITQAHANADYLRNPRPVYPAIARSRHWEGLVLLRVHVLADGDNDHVEIQRGSGYEVLDEAAREAVEKWQFVPSKHGDTAVASWVTVPIEFVLK